MVELVEVELASRRAGQFSRFRFSARDCDGPDLVVSPATQSSKARRHVVVASIAELLSNTPALCNK